MAVHALSYLVSLMVLLAGWRASHACHCTHELLDCSSALHQDNAASDCRCEGCIVRAARVSSTVKLQQLFELKLPLLHAMQAVLEPEMSPVSRLLGTLDREP